LQPSSLPREFLVSKLAFRVKCNLYRYSEEVLKAVLDLSRVEEEERQRNEARELAAAAAGLAECLTPRRELAAAAAAGLAACLTPLKTTGVAGAGGAGAGGAGVGVGVGGVTGDGLYKLNSVYP
jgi:hypothetical protein